MNFATWKKLKILVKKTIGLILSSVKFGWCMCKKFISNIAPLNIWLCFSFVESKCFINLLGFQSLNGPFQSNLEVYMILV
jgi:hypothetical protein